MFESFSSLGVRRKFPRVKPYLRSYVIGPLRVQEEVERLARYAGGGSFLFRFAPEFSEHLYTSFHAGKSLGRISVVKRWQAIQMALIEGGDWTATWAQSISYAYWAARLDCRLHAYALAQFERGERQQKLQMLFLHSMGGHIANCLALSWSEWAIDMTRRVHSALDLDMFNDGGDEAHRRTQHFILRLVGDWQGWPPRDGPRCAFDEPLFNTLIEQWRTPDPEDLKPFLLAACDRHTHQARPDTNKGHFDMPYGGMEYDPFEILSILRLRELNGLANPTLDHLVMNTPLGRLPAATPPYSNALLDGVLARARHEFPDL